MDALAWAMRDARIGLFPAADAVARLREQFLAAVNGDAERARQHPHPEQEVDKLVARGVGLAAAMTEREVFDRHWDAIEAGTIGMTFRDTDGNEIGPEPPPQQDAGEPPPEVREAPFELTVVTLDAFAAVVEEGADALLGDRNDILIPTNGDVMVYGDGGAGKTTLCLDLACHLSAGAGWLGIEVARPLRVLLIENEGPRPLFRAKTGRKLKGWLGGALGGRLHVVEQPWAAFTFADEAMRAALATAIAEHDIDIVIIGQLAAAGMNEAGTLQEVRQFIGLCNDVRRRSGRHVTFVLIHHENKGGKVSGAWEGAGDTLLHVQGMGHGRTRLHVQKARWSTSWHAQTLELLWTEGESFAVVDKPEVSDDDLAALLLAFIGESPGTGWKRVEDGTSGSGPPRSGGSATDCWPTG
jgi:hypothetical protein